MFHFHHCNVELMRTAFIVHCNFSHMLTQFTQRNQMNSLHFEGRNAIELQPAHCACIVVEFNYFFILYAHQMHATT